MIFIKRVITSLFTFFLAVVVGCFGVSTAHASTEKVTGYWAKKDSTYLYKFEAHFELNESVDGYFLWTLLVSPSSSESNKIGLQGKEFVKGSFDKKSRQLSLKGYTKEDPHAILGLDAYRLEVSNDEREFFGITSADGSWTGRIASKIDQVSSGTSVSSRNSTVPGSKSFAGGVGQTLSATTGATCIHNGDGTFTAKDGSIWQMCSIGQKFENGRCTGKALSAPLTDILMAARANEFLGHNDWILPSFRLFKVNFFDGQCNVQGASIQPADSVARQFSMTGVEDYFWTTDVRSDRGSGLGLGISTNNAVIAASGLEGYDVTSIDSGRLKNRGGYKDIQAVLVRNATRIDVDYFVSAEIRVRTIQLAEEQKAIASANAERKTQADRAAALRSLVASGAQALYLEAGKAQRNGGVTHNGQSFYESELYELVIEKFPNSPFAVKASDQLSALKRTEVVRDADRNSSNRAACFSGVNSCVAGCRSRGMSYDTTQFCVSQCQRSCN